MANLNDLWKKGSGQPLPTALVEGGLGVDIVNKKVYSKAADGQVFEIGATSLNERIGDIETILDAINGV